MTGFFIAFEGGDGCGKSTVSKLVKTQLKREGHGVVLTREPGGTELGKHIREILLHGGSIHPTTEALLFAADRAEHFHTVILPALDAGKVVITDRFVDSSLAYQHYGRGLDYETVFRPSVIATDNTAPELTIVLDLDPANPHGKRDATDRFETTDLEFRQRVRQGFLAQASKSPEFYRVIDATQSVDAVFREAMEAIHERL